jgi:transposase
MAYWRNSFKEAAMSPRYRVTLTEQERKELEALTKRGVTHARRVLHARALLLSDASVDGPSWSVSDTSEALGVSERTIEHLKKRFVEEGLEAALERKKREKPPREVRFDGAFEARLIALACSDAPEGHRRWTVSLLADKAVELNFAESVSLMTVHRVLKKTNFSLTAANTGKSPQKEVRRL